MKPPAQMLQRINIANIGWVLSAWLLVTAALALNRGIDLLWGMAALLASAIAAALLLPLLQLRGIAVRRVVPAEGTAGQALALEYEIEIRGKLPRYGLELLDRLGAAPTELVPAAYFHKLRGCERLRFSWIPAVRGSRLFEQVVIECRYPLGLIRMRRSFALQQQALLIYPAVVPLRGLPVDYGTEPQARLVLSNRRGGHDEYFGVRPYQPGDTPRAIHWRASARSDALLTREYEHQHDRRLWLVLELNEALHTGHGAAGTAETMFRIAHSLVVKARSEGIPIGLLYRDAAGVRQLEPALDQVSYLRLRRTLALAATGQQAPVDSWLAAEAAGLPKGGTWLVFNLAGADRRGALTTLCRRRQVQPLLLEFDRQAFLSAPPGPRQPVMRHRHSGVPIWIVAPNSDLGGLLS